MHIYVGPNLSLASMSLHLTVVSVRNDSVSHRHNSTLMTVSGLITLLVTIKLGS